MMFMNRAKTKQNGSMIQEFQFKKQNQLSVLFVETTNQNEKIYMAKANKNVMMMKIKTNAYTAQLI